LFEISDREHKLLDDQFLDEVLQFDFFHQFRKFRIVLLCEFRRFGGTDEIG
jgi:hypothetical protein